MSINLLGDRAILFGLVTRRALLRAIQASGQFRRAVRDDCRYTTRRPSAIGKQESNYA